MKNHSRCHVRHKCLRFWCHDRRRIGRGDSSATFDITSLREEETGTAKRVLGANSTKTWVPFRATNGRLQNNSYNVARQPPSRGLQPAERRIMFSPADVHPGRAHYAPLKRIRSYPTRAKRDCVSAQEITVRHPEILFDERASERASGRALNVNITSFYLVRAR